VTPAGVVAGRLLAAFAPQDCAQACAILSGWVRVPGLSVDDVRTILAGYPSSLSLAQETPDDDELRDTHVPVQGGDQHSTFPVGDPNRGTP
jgi:hypothetical protein